MAAYCSACMCMFAKIREQVCIAGVVKYRKESLREVWNHIDKITNERAYAQFTNWYKAAGKIDYDWAILERTHSSKTD